MKIALIFILLYIDRNDEARDRDSLRMERHKERARERNLARAAPDKRYVEKYQVLTFGLNYQYYKYMNFIGIDCRRNATEISVNK